MKRISWISGVILISMTVSAVVFAVENLQAGNGAGEDGFLKLPSTIYVPGTYPTIQGAIDSAAGGDTIIVSRGTYNENIDFKGKNLIVRSTDPFDSNTIENTIIDGQEAGSVVTFLGSENENCILSGFTIRQGLAERGGGINGHGCAATIQYNYIASNIATNGTAEGGGLYSCNGIIQYNRIYNNQAIGGSYSYGGGLSDCDGTIQCNIIYANSANSTYSNRGGGLYGCDGTIQNNLIYNNSADYNGYGGGFASCNGTIQNNTIWSNSAESRGGGLYNCYGTIRNCIIWQNSASEGSQIYSYEEPHPIYCCIQDWTTGTGNISGPPDLVDPNSGDFHFRSSSTCIDAGCLISGLNEDLEGNHRPYNGSSVPRGDGSDYDIGAYEYCHAPSPDYVMPLMDSTDYNGDGTSDIAIFRPSSGLWSVRGITRVYFGGSSDQPVPGDYTGGGTTRIAIFRPSSGLWAVRGFTRTYFGGSSDRPVPGDYTGSGATDIGLFRPATGLWAIRGVTRVYFGSSADSPVPGYYKSGGAALAILRAASGLWAVRGVTRVYFGSGTDQPVPGDYNGSGNWRPAIFRPSSGLWAVRGVTRAYFGGSADKPMPGNFRGDGIDKIGLFRESSGLWAIRGVSRAYFGASGDIPVTR